MLNNEKAKNLLFANTNGIEKSQQIAKNNYSACIRQIPRSLIACKKKLFKMIKKSNHDPIKMLRKLNAYMDDLYRYEAIRAWGKMNRFAEGRCALQ